MIDGENHYVRAGLLFAAGAALVLLMPKREREDAARRVHQAEHWEPSARITTAAVGAALMLYGMKTTGKVAKLAATSGAGLLMRSIADEPIDSWRDVLPANSFHSLISSL